MDSLTGLGKLILMLGLFMVIIGGLLMVVGKIPGLGRLPGDIFVQRGNFTFYFPVVTMIIVSLVLTLLLNVLFRR
ncbi:DUF2905 domain-containing protein [Desulfoscipio gibsoniae]|uniref:DUF2905 domain-containing protein n=1 Tax=Desulfoscipio gibsoniae DSM 7213 TaxID=767817 RepID=R4KNN4_9FIRM|nr:DUF2905 domain-containing protein [Desulfoscipio gibsoniae]AGL01241.1 Protein of unknown function (DUF2905) [Desulfoscipio gibsoniae DSM 7213]